MEQQLPINSNLEAPMSSSNSSKLENIMATLRSLRLENEMTETYNEAAIVDSFFSSNNGNMTSHSLAVNSVPNQTYAAYGDQQRSLSDTTTPLYSQHIATDYGASMSTFNLRNDQINSHSLNMPSSSSSSSNVLIGSSTMNLDLNDLLPNQNQSRDDLVFDSGRYYYNSNNKNWNIVEIAKTSIGSRYYQSLVSSGEERIIDYILEDILDELVVLMTDRCGRHLFIRIIESCNQSQLRLILANLIYSDDLLIVASCDRYGSQSIKKLIAVLQNSPMVSIITSILSRAFHIIMINGIGCSVILSCLEILHPKRYEALCVAAVEYCIELGRHDKGCVSLNNFIKLVNGPFRIPLLLTIAENSVLLSHDPHGNYVVQQVLAQEHPVINSIVCNLLKGHYVELSLQRGGSHVVEKCLNSPDLFHAVEDLLNNGSLLELAQDQYGNFVVQCALKATKRVKSPLHGILVDILKKHSRALKCGYGRNVFNLIHKGVPLD